MKIINRKSKNKAKHEKRFFLSFSLNLLCVEVGYKLDIIHGVESNITLDMLRRKRQLHENLTCSVVYILRRLERSAT